MQESPDLRPAQMPETPLSARQEDATVPLGAVEQSRMRSRGYSMDEYDRLLSSEATGSIEDKIIPKITMYYQVQGMVHNGKIYWRIVDDKLQVVYDRSKEKDKVIEFDSDQSWLMSWQQFWEFKSSGKRHSNATITKALFVSKFKSQSQEQAGLIWEELREKNIITHKLKLSDSWRLQSGSHLKMQTTGLGSITHDDIAEAFHEITCVEHYYESFPVSDLIKLTRQERSPKMWMGNDGWLQNHAPESAEYCVKLWDVSLYLEMIAHSNMAEEKRLYVEKLIYAHLPSVAENKEFSQKCITAFTAQIKNYQATLNFLLSNIDQYSQNKISEKPVHAELKQFQPSDLPLDELQSQIDSLQENIALHEGAIALFRAELQSTHGGYWWAIAIPKRLYSQEKDFLQDNTQSTDQPALLRDVTNYLNLLEAHPEEFKLTQSDILNAMGAFRFLYHKEVTLSTKIPDVHKHVGYAPNGLLNDPKHFKALDTFFNQRIKKHLSQQKGSDPELALAPRKIKF